MTLDSHLPASTDREFQDMKRRLAVLERTQPAIDLGGDQVAAFEGGTGLAMGDLGTVGPAVSFGVGKSGLVLIMASAGVYTVGTGATVAGIMEVWCYCTVGAGVGGTTVLTGPGLTNTAATDLTVSVSSIAVETLPEGSYTATLKYSTTGTANFFNRSLVVQPF